MTRFQEFRISGYLTLTKVLQRKLNEQKWPKTANFLKNLRKKNQ